MRSIPTVLLFLALTTPALATDGVLEINQTCADSGGCFAGDGAGLPVTISSSLGRTSFVLTSDLVVPNRNVDAILVLQNDTTIDLNGFSIVFPNTQAGPGRGVNGASAVRTTVKQGSIRFSGSDGVLLGNDSRAEDLIVQSSGGIGISTGGQSIVANNRVTSSGSHGILGLFGVRVEKNFVVLSGGNGLGDGIQVRDGSLVIDNTVRFSTGHCIWGTEVGGTGFNAPLLIIDRNLCGDIDGSGIGVGLGSTVTRNTVNRSGGTGIIATAGASIVGNMVTNSASQGILSFGGLVSGNTSNANTFHGISVTSGTLVTGNSVANNGAFGLDLSSVDAYRGNIIHGNAGTVGGVGVNAGGNVCDASLTCP